MKTLNDQKNEALEQLEELADAMRSVNNLDDIVIDLKIAINFGFRYGSARSIAEACGSLSMLKHFVASAEMKSVINELHSLCSLKLTELKKG